MNAMNLAAAVFSGLVAVFAMRVNRILFLINAAICAGNVFLAFKGLKP